MEDSGQSKYPLLEAMLCIKQVALKPTYTNADVAALFDVSIRTVQSRVADGSLPSRKLIGRARFLPVDLEQFLSNGRDGSES